MMLVACSSPTTCKTKVIWMVDSIVIDQQKVHLQSTFASLQNNKTFLLPIPINNSQQDIYETDISNATGNYLFLNDTVEGSVLVRLTSDYKTYNGLYYAELYNKENKHYLKLQNQDITFYFAQWLH
jgi:hypothetical protein